MGEYSQYGQSYGVEHVLSIEEYHVPNPDGNLNIEVPGVDRKEPLDHQEFLLAGRNLSVQLRDVLIDQHGHCAQLQLVILLVEAIEISDEGPSYYQVVEALEGFLAVKYQKQHGRKVGHPLHIPNSRVECLEHLQHLFEVLKQSLRRVEEVELGEGSGDVRTDQFLGQRVYLATLQLQIAEV